MTILTPAPTTIATALAAVARRRDFAFSGDLSRAAWITDEAIEWWDGTAPPGRFPLREPLPANSHLVLVGGTIGVLRPTDAGAELAWIDTVARTSGSLVSLSSPQAVLLPLLPGASWQMLAVGGFDGTTTLSRIDWPGAGIETVGQLPVLLSGGVWLESDGSRLAANLVGDTGRSSVHVVDLDSLASKLLFDGAHGSEDRAVAYDHGLGVLAITTNAPGHAAVALARPGRGGVDWLRPLEHGDEAGVPVGFVTVADGSRRLVLRHEDGACARLRLADPDTLEISAPLPIPDGEVSHPVAISGSRLRFPWSTYDVPWRTAAIDLAADPPHFTLEPDPADDDPPPARPGWATTVDGPAGPMPVVLLEPADRSSDLAVVALHGGPFARWSAAYDAELQLFAQLGLAVYALDYPGSTGSGQRLVNAILGRAGEVDVEAVSAVCDAVEAETGRRVILYGESYGAFLALATAATRNGPPVIAFAPFASFDSLRHRGSPAVREVVELLGSEKIGTKGRNLPDSCRTVPIKVLIAHGTADKTIPVEESRSIVAALQERKGSGEDDVRFVELYGQGHELVSRPALEQWYWEIAEFVGGLSLRDRLPNEWHQQQGR